MLIYTFGNYLVFNDPQYLYHTSRWSPLPIRIVHTQVSARLCEILLGKDWQLALHADLPSTHFWHSPKGKATNLRSWLFGAHHWYHTCCCLPCTDTLSLFTMPGWNLSWYDSILECWNQYYEDFWPNALTTLSIHHLTYT